MATKLVYDLKIMILDAQDFDFSAILDAEIFKSGVSKTLHDLQSAGFRAIQIATVGVEDNSLTSCPIILKDLKNMEERKVEDCFDTFDFLKTTESMQSDVNGTIENLSSAISEQQALLSEMQPDGGYQRWVDLEFASFGTTIISPQLLLLLLLLLFLLLLI